MNKINYEQQLMKSFQIILGDFNMNFLIDLDIYKKNNGEIVSFYSFKGDKFGPLYITGLGERDRKSVV